VPYQGRRGIRSLLEAWSTCSVGSRSRRATILSACSM
jgi:hypothetical protein